MPFRRLLAVGSVAVALALAVYLPVSAAGWLSASAHSNAIPTVAHPAITYKAAGKLKTTTPIKHLVVIFGENVSFDHYFGTYPHAANLAGETKWVAKKGTPSVNGLTPALLTHNPNQDNPVRLSPKQALTCDMNHNYAPEQKAEDGGLMDRFVQNLTGSPYTAYEYCPADIDMGYYDGNTVTGLWNYAQNFALNDNSWDTDYGPSTPGAVNLISGDTGAVLCGPSGADLNVSPCTATPPTYTAGQTLGTNFGDDDPYYDICSNNYDRTPAKDIALTGPNIGTMLDSAKVTWGWFQGGFGDCMSATPPLDGPTLGLQAQGATVAQDPGDETTDYSPHHEPFQYYASTSNPNHLPPTSVAMIGSEDQANHQYDISWFWKAADSGHLPAVSFLKAPRFEDGHPDYSDPLDEQNFDVSTINALEKLKTWSSTAVVILYDDSDGWYDHDYGPKINQSNASIDSFCGTTASGSQPGRCGYGPRLPLLVISPYSKVNSVDHSLTDQTSVIQFIEDNWLHGARVSSESFDNWAGSLDSMFSFKGKARAPKLFMNPETGIITKH